MIAPSTQECLFCTWEDPARHRIIAENDLAYARWDDFPEAEGHALVIPKIHVENYFGLSPEQMAAMLVISSEVKVTIDETYQPDGYNVFSNVGAHAGQVIMHAHVHILPRYAGDEPVVLGNHHRTA